MKRIFIFVLVLSFTLVSCSRAEKLSAYDVFKDFSAHAEIPACEVFCYVSDERNDSVLSRLYGDYDAMAYCDDYVICLFLGDEIWELHILRTASVYDNKNVKEMLIRRRDLLQKEENGKFYSEKTDLRVREAEIIERNNFVILAITDHNDSIRDTRLFQ